MYISHPPDKPRCKSLILQHFTHFSALFCAKLFYSAPFNHKVSEYHPVDHDEFKTITNKVFGSITLLTGVFYLKRIAKFGKQ